VGRLTQKRHAFPSIEIQIPLDRLSADSRDSRRHIAQLLFHTGGRDRQGGQGGYLLSSALNLQTKRKYK